jgi:U2 small nuclear ribonucleoprotein B''
LKSSNPAAGAVIPEEYLPPNKTLFLQNLPDDVDKEALTRIFAAFEGFQEVRTVPGRKGIAFVEYEAEAGAISAKERTANMLVGQEGRAMKVVYQRK